MKPASTAPRMPTMTFMMQPRRSRTTSEAIQPARAPKTIHDSQPMALLLGPLDGGGQGGQGGQGLLGIGPATDGQTDQIAGQRPGDAGYPMGDIAGQIQQRVAAV